MGARSECGGGGGGAKTKGKSIEWQTPKIEGTILRSDAEGHPWKREVTVPDEATAIAYIKQCLGIGGAE